MATELMRLTFAVTPEISLKFDEFKRENYNMNQSEVIRYLIDLGFKTWQENKNSPTAATGGERE